MDPRGSVQDLAVKCQSERGRRVSDFDRCCLWIFVASWPKGASASPTAVSGSAIRFDTHRPDAGTHLEGMCAVAVTWQHGLGLFTNPDE